LIFEGGIAQSARALAATPLATLTAGTHHRLNARLRHSETADAFPLSLEERPAADITPMAEVGPD